MKRKIIYSLIAFGMVFLLAGSFALAQLFSIGSAGENLLITVIDDVEYKSLSVNFPVSQEWHDYLINNPAVFQIDIFQENTNFLFHMNHPSLKDTLKDIEAMEILSRMEVMKTSQTNTEYLTTENFMWKEKIWFAERESDGRAIQCMIAGNGLISSMSFTSQVGGGFVTNQAADIQACQQTMDLPPSQFCQNNPGHPLC